MARTAPYPLFLNLHGRSCLIVGGGSVALRKATGLLAAGAAVTVVAPNVCADLLELPVTRLAEPYAASHMTLAAWTLVLAATNSPAVNAAIAADAAAQRILCTRSDAPDESDFANGATATLGDVAGGGGITLAVSTAHASPVLGQKIRDTAVAAIDPLMVTWVELCSRWRERVLAQVADAGVRRGLLKRLAGPEMEAALRAGGPAEAERTFAAWLAEA